MPVSDERTGSPATLPVVGVDLDLGLMWVLDILTKQLHEDTLHTVWAIHESHTPDQPQLPSRAL